MIKILNIGRDLQKEKKTEEESANRLGISGSLIKLAQAKWVDIGQVLFLCV